MHEWGDSGITAVLLAIGVALLLSFVLTQQARTRAARYKEIRRLQSVAAEEARREEEEARAEYTSMVASRNYCAVCFNSSTTRCSRCKAVRYCSSACQAKHWKDGHKQECRAPDPVPSPRSSSNGSRVFSEVFSNSGSPGSRDSTVLSEASKVHSVEHATPAELSGNHTASANGNGTLVRPTKILFPYEYFAKLFNWERLKVPPCGLLNCGNSCFANVVLQCLTYTRPLTAYLLEGSHGEECTRVDWCFLCELQDHVWRVKQDQTPFSPIRILSRIRNIGNHLGYGRQEDAHEFMRFAIDSMQSICLDEAGGEKAVDPRSQETTFIHYIFGGHLQSQVKCMMCLHESNRYENMMDLAVEIQGCVETLEDALTQFTAPEWLDGDNKYKCDRCNAYVKARKRLTLHEAPNILTIALKRFQSGKFGKLNKRVTFPEVLDVSQYMSGKGDVPPLYRLYAVVVHVDMLNASFFGHYICYVKDSQGLWYKIDDSKVKEVDLEKVMAQRAYMLFYTRSIARPPPLMDGVVSPYPVAEAVDLGKICSNSLGGLKEFTSSHYAGSDEVFEGVGNQGLHAMVDFNQMLDYVEPEPETVTEQHMLPNGQIATIQPSTWETERVLASASNSDEIEVEEAECIASSSSLTQTSPCMSSFTSNQGLWIPTQGFVYQVPESGSVEGAEYAAWDPKSSLPDDFSEVSLQPGTVEQQPCSSTKVGKRRLEDGLSPLPTPKPLDTDQLPAWPTGSSGRANSCLPSVAYLSSANPISCSTMPGELQSSLQKSESEMTGEPSPSGTLPLHQTIVGEVLYLPTALGESSPELEMADCVVADTKGPEEDELAVPAKRQHVESDGGTDLIAVLERPSEILQVVQPSSTSDAGGSDMDWDGTSEHSGVILGPVSEQCEDLLVDTSKSSSLGEVVLNHQPAAFQSLLPSESPRSIGRSSSQEDDAAQGNELEKAHQGTIMKQPESSETVQLLSHPHGRLLEEVLEAAVSRPDVIRQDPPSPPSQSVDEDVNSRESTETAPKGSVSVTDTPAAKEFVSSTGTPAVVEQASNGPADQPRHRKAQTSKAASSKPLFAPGFLNKPRASGGSKGRISSTTPSKTAAGEPVENRHLGKVDGQASDNAAAAAADKTSSTTPSKAAATQENGHLGKLDCQAAENAAANGGESHSKDVGDHLHPPEITPPGLVINRDVPSTVPNGEEYRCGNCNNCEACNSVHSESRLENGHQPVMGGTAPDSNDKHLAKNGSNNENGSSSSSSPLSSSRKSSGLNGSPNGSRSSASSPRVNDGEEPLREPAAAPAAPPISKRPTAGKQKQGRNETCNCGSQRKWKKCCGKAGVMKPEQQTRRLVV